MTTLVASKQPVGTGLDRYEVALGPEQAFLAERGGADQLGCGDQQARPAKPTRQPPAPD